MMTYSWKEHEPAWYRGLLPLRWSFSFFIDSDDNVRATDSFGWEEPRSINIVATA